MNGELPKDWELVKLGAVCKTATGGTPLRSNSKYYNGSIPWIKSGELEHNVIIDSEEKITEVAIKESNAKIFPKGSILIALYGATIGKLATLGIDATTNQAICAVFKSDKIESKYLFQFLSFKKQFFIKQAFGGAQPNISQTILRNLDIPLPSLLEQTCIVAKIEELFSDLDKGIENLKTAQLQLKTYRQAVLKYAFEGRLTNVNVKEGELPEGWRIVKLADVSDSCLGKMLDRQKNVGQYQPYLRNINVRWGAFELDNLHEMKFKKDEEERYGIRKGDLIICEGGEPGRAAIWKTEDTNMKIQKALHRVRFDRTIIPEYFYYFIVLIGSNKKLDQYFTGTTIKHLTGQSLRKITFPAPSIIEQHRIVEEIEDRLSVCDKVEETIESSLLQCESLRQSILKKAFEGRLV